MMARPNALTSLLTALFLGAAAGAHGIAADLAFEPVGVVKPDGARHVTVADARDLIAALPRIVVLDVRTPDEFSEGHIAGAVNIDYFAADFREQIARLDPATPYLLHCKSGRRSGHAAPIMRKAGISAVIHMDGGFDAWRAAGYPVATPTRG